MSNSFRFLALGFLAVSIMTAQKPAPPAAPSGQTSAPGAPISLPGGSNSEGPWPGTRIPVMLSGTVVIEGGGGPAPTVAIQRFCGDLAHTVAWTDAKGRFSFQWNDYSGVTLEASDTEPNSAALPNGLSRGNSSGDGGSSKSQQLPGLNMLNCQLQAEAPGFRSDRIDLSDHRALDNPDLGNIVLHRVARVKGVSISATELSAPKSARKALEHGVALSQSDQQSDRSLAETEFEKAVRIDPQFATAWVYLGNARERRLQEDLACDAFRKAIAADSRQAEAFIGLGMVASRREQWQQAAQYLDRALLLNPVDFPHLWYDDALADYHVGNLDRAEKNVREAVKQDAPIKERRALWLLGMVLFDKHDYAGARAALTAYMRTAPDVDDLTDTLATLEEIRTHLRAKQ